MPRRVGLTFIAAAALLSGCANDPPVADFTLAPNPTQGQRVIFDASASSPGRDEADQPLAINRYEWDLDGNGSYERETQGPTVAREYEGTGTIEVSLRVTNVRSQRASTARTVSTSPTATAVAPSSTCAATMPSSAGCGGGPLGSNFEDEQTEVRLPNYAQQPVFRSFFGSFVPSGSDQRVAVATGADRVYVLRTDGASSFVTVFDASSLQQLRDQQVLSNARDISFYRGEVFIQATSGGSWVLDPNGALKRTVPPPSPGAHGIVEELSFSNVTVAWKEIWSTFSLGNKQGSGVYVRDAATGAVKSILVHRARSECKLTLHTADGGESCIEPTSAASGGATLSWDASETAGINAIPEVNALVSQCRAIERRNILGFTIGQDSMLASDAASPLIVPECFGAGSRGHFMGSDGVPGQRRFLQTLKWLSGGQAEDLIVEYDVSPADLQSSPDLSPAQQATGRIELAERRAWTPKDALSGNYRDLAYRPRETKLDWSGVLTNDPTDWLRSPSDTEDKCLHYLLSDADIYVVGHRGERWYDLATGLNRVDLLVDGAVVKSSTVPEGDFCINTRSFASGTHTIEVRAHLDNWTKTVKAVNEHLRIDNTAPQGELVAPELDVRGTVRFEGTFEDPHAGPREWAFEVQPAGSTMWREVCKGALDAASGRYACSWNSADGLSSDGDYRIRARMTDAAGEGGNTRHSAVWEPLAVTNSGEWDETNHDATYDQTDGFRAGLPETFFEPPAPDTPPDERGAADASEGPALACGPSDPYEISIMPAFGPGPTGNLVGSPTPEAEIQFFMALPDSPHIPVALFTQHSQGPGWTTWVVREADAIVATIHMHKAPSGGWLAEEMTGCNGFVERFSAPDATGATTGVAPVDDATSTVESNLGGIP